MSEVPIKFNRPFMTGKELYYIAEAKLANHLAGDGRFTKICHEWLQVKTGSKKALLTHSCTAALEMAAILLDIKPGDEVIMPSFTFVSTANAFVLRGAVPVFVDIREDTLNLDEAMIEEAITSATKAVVPVHYAGVGCEMDKILEIARRHNIAVVEDAAQGVMAKYKGRHLGSIGDLGTLSFHETKNVISGEGGALLVNATRFESRAEIIREKGTDRSRFFRDEVDKYTWQDIGSSFLPGEMVAAFLWAQLEEAARITERRMKSWSWYHKALEPLEDLGMLRRPIILDECEHNAHMYYVLLNEGADRQKVLEKLKSAGIHSLFHYIPLHSSPGGMKFGRAVGALKTTDRQSQRLIRLPLWVGISHEDQERVVGTLMRILRS